MDRKGWKVTGNLTLRLSDFLKVITAILSMENRAIGAGFTETQCRDLTAKFFFPL